MAAYRRLPIADWYSFKSAAGSSSLRFRGRSEGDRGVTSGFAPEGSVTNTFPPVFRLNGERLIVVHIVIVDYLHSLVGGSLIAIRPEGTKSNR